MGHWKTGGILYVFCCFDFFLKLGMLFDIGTWNEVVLLLISKNIVTINKSYVKTANLSEPCLVSLGQCLKNKGRIVQRAKSEK